MSCERLRTTVDGDAWLVECLDCGCYWWLSDAELEAS